MGVQLAILVFVHNVAYENVLLFVPGRQLLTGEHCDSVYIGLSIITVSIWHLFLGMLLAKRLQQADGGTD